MNELRQCRNTWMYCDGHCGRCATVITTSNTVVPIRVEYITADNKTYFPNCGAKDGRGGRMNLKLKKILQEEGLLYPDIPHAEIAFTQVGRWEDVEHAPNGLLYATCSVCGKRQTIETTNYCGNCGARMVKE